MQPQLSEHLSYLNPSSQLFEPFISVGAQMHTISIIRQFSTHGGSKLPDKVGRYPAAGTMQYISKQTGMITSASELLGQSWKSEQSCTSGVRPRARMLSTTPFLLDVSQHGCCYSHLVTHLLIRGTTGDASAGSNKHNVHYTLGSCCNTCLHL